MEATLKHCSGILKVYNSNVALSPGQVVVKNERIGVVSGTKPIAVGDDYTLETEGVFEMDAKEDDEWVDGDVLYWDNTNNYLTETAGSNKKAGLAVGDQVATDTRAMVDINKRQ